MSIVSAILFIIFGKVWLAHIANQVWFIILTRWFFCVILSSAFAVLRHAESSAAIAPIFYKAPFIRYYF
jgi:hypothetical protein